MVEPSRSSDVYQQFADDLRMGHTALRRNLATLSSRDARTPQERERLLDLAAVYTAFLYRHHEAEDHFLFRALADHTAGRSSDAAFLEARVAEHRQVHLLLDAWTAEIARSKATVARPLDGSHRFALELGPLLVPHLDAEERALDRESLALMLPEEVMRQTLEDSAKHIGRVGGADVVMLLVHSLDEQERETLREQTSWVFQKVFVDTIFEWKFAGLAPFAPFPEAKL